MDKRPIETECEYDSALAEVARYFEQEQEPGSTEAARFAVLSTLIGAYEDAYWPIEPPDPASAA